MGGCASLPSNLSRILRCVGDCDPWICCRGKWWHLWWNPGGFLELQYYYSICFCPGCGFCYFGRLLLDHSCLYETSYLDYWYSSNRLGNRHGYRLLRSSLLQRSDRLPHLLRILHHLFHLLDPSHPILSVDAPNRHRCLQELRTCLHGISYWRTHRYRIRRLVLCHHGHDLCANQERRFDTVCGHGV